MKTINHILVVCTGNSCRSPFAEQLLKARLGSTLPTVISAGTHAPEGKAPPQQTVTQSAVYGLNLSSHRARQVTHKMVRAADVVLVMSPKHKTLLHQWAPDSREKIFLFTEFGPNGKLVDIPDPIGQSDGVYQRVFARIDEEINRILPVLKPERLRP